jgi:hypothetical protein
VPGGGQDERETGDANDADFGTGMPEAIRGERMGQWQEWQERERAAGTDTETQR